LTEFSTGKLICHRVFSWHSEYYKAPYLYEQLGVTSSLVSICDPKKHKIHRSVVTPLFAKQSIDRLAPTVADKVEDAVEVMRQCSAQGKPVDIQTLYRCITVSHISVFNQRKISGLGVVGSICPGAKADATYHQIDMISKTVFGLSQNLVGSYDGEKPLMDSLDLFMTSLALMKHLPILQTTALNLPSSLSGKLLPGYSSFRKVGHNRANNAPVWLLIFCNQGLFKVDLERRSTERKRTSSERGRNYYHIRLDARTRSEERI